MREACFCRTSTHSILDALVEGSLVNQRVGEPRDKTVPSSYCVLKHQMVLTEFEKKTFLIAKKSTLHAELFKEKFFI